MASTEKTKSCPICDKLVPPRSEAEAYPFCSQRCQLADLGKWLDGDYTIPDVPDFSLDD
jgi:endogenous inhibitor of DNA gyrase (YacG/DUF329 family)